MLVNGSCLVLRDRLLIALLRGLAILFKVSLFVIVEADDVGFVSLRWSIALLDSASVHRSYVRSIRSATIMSLLLAISLRLSLGTTIVVRYALLALPLLSSLELTIVDSDGVIHIDVERFSITIDLDKLVLDVVLKSIVESSLKHVGSLVDPEGKLSESRGILDSRLSLAKVIKILLCPSSLIVYSENFDEYILEASKGYKDNVGLRALLG